MEGCQWKEDRGVWQITVTDLETGRHVHDWCHILVHATGYLNKLQWPKISGWDNFKGTKLHSADYDDKVSLEGKNILLIGAGSSAVQILLAIQPIVNKVKIFIRSPTWVLPGISDATGEYSQEQIAQYVAYPEKVQLLRQENEQRMNSIFSKYYCHFRIGFSRS